MPWKMSGEKKYRRWADVLAQRPVSDEELADTRAAREAYVRGWKLAELRRRADRTQVELAGDMGVSQTWVSELERGDLERAQLRTLRSYAEAIGGHLRIAIDFDDGESFRVA